MFVISCADSALFSLTERFVPLALPDDVISSSGEVNSSSHAGDDVLRAKFIFVLVTKYSRSFINEFKTIDPIRWKT